MLAQHPFLWLVLAAFGAFGVTLAGAAAWVRLK